MHILKFIAGVLLASFTLATANAASNEQNVLINNMPISEVLSFYEELLGQKIATPSAIKMTAPPITAKIHQKSKQEALKILDEALATQARVEISREPDGSYLARRIAQRK